MKDKKPPKRVYYTASYIATAEEAAEASALGLTMFRNANFAHFPEAGVVAVAGKVPACYKGTKVQILSAPKPAKAKEPEQKA